MNSVFLGLGANLNQPATQIRSAVAALQSNDNIEVVACSSLYGSKPMGPQDQPDYINAVIQVETSLSAMTLLDVTQGIELKLGRVRKDERWGPRTLDIDILLFNQEEINQERLQVPHYGMKEREFVLYPLAEIAPNLTMPDDTPISDLLNYININGLTKLSSL